MAALSLLFLLHVALEIYRPPSRMAGGAEEADRLRKVSGGPEPEELGARKAKGAGRLLDGEEKPILS